MRLSIGAIRRIVGDREFEQHYNIEEQDKKWSYFPVPVLEEKINRVYMPPMSDIYGMDEKFDGPSGWLQMFLDDYELKEILLTEATRESYYVSYLNNGAHVNQEIYIWYRKSLKWLSPTMYGSFLVEFYAGMSPDLKYMVNQGRLSSLSVIIATIIDQLNTDVVKFCKG